MNSFDIDIFAREQGLSAEIYEFTFTSGSVQRYTSFERDLVAADLPSAFQHTYTHVPIERSEIETDNVLSSTPMRITAPVLNLWANMGIQNGRITVKIVKVFLDDKTYQTIFDGLVLSITKNVGQGEASCASKMYYLEKQLPRVFFQDACNNTLFDDMCTLTKQQYSFSAVVSSSGYLLTLDDTDYANFIIAFIAVYGAPTGGVLKPIFTLGQALYGGETRYITKQDTLSGHHQIWLHYPFNGLTAGTISVDLVAGCDKTGGYCLGVFKNILNFIGMPYMPNTDSTLQAVGT